MDAGWQRSSPETQAGFEALKDCLQFGCRLERSRECSEPLLLNNGTGRLGEHHGVLKLETPVNS